MAETTEKTLSQLNCFRCGEKCEGAGSGFITICQSKGRASGQEVASIHLCAECLSECRKAIDAFLLN